MKKLFAILLALAMVLPMGMTFAAADENPVEVSPFYMLNFATIREGSFDNVADCPFFWTNQENGNPITWGGSEIKGLAKRVKDLFDSRPVGMRYIRFSPISSYFKTYKENHVYLDKGATKLKVWLEEFLAEYKKIGGQLDGFMLDVEIVEMNSYYIWQDAKKNNMVYNEIVSDPRYATEIRPLLEERGFTFWSNPNEYTPEIFAISRDTGDKFADDRAIWDRVMRNRLATYINWSVCEPLWQHYPNAIVSDYQTADRASWFKFLSDTGDNSFGELTVYGGNTMKVGNASNNNVYHCRPSDLFYKNSRGEIIFRNPYAYNEAVYDKTAFNMTLWELNTFKNIYASTDNKTLNAWLTSYNYGDRPLAYSGYTSEIVYHIGMLNPQPFFGYVVESECPDVEYFDRLKVISQQLHELTRVAGYADRKPIEVPANWNDSYILSGMYANGRNIWRITPDTTQVTLEDFKIEGTDPTFRVNGKTITFPGGKIIEDTKIDAVGSCGYWVETAKDVTPIITTDANRYERYPSLFIGFDDFAEGDFNYNTANPLGAWKMTWDKPNGAATTIVAHNGGKAMAINGTASLHNIHLPANITAGDSYAKDQTWDVTVTIPEGLSAEAVITLLNYAGFRQDGDDGGFKVAGGKVYYGTIGPKDEFDTPTVEYKELANISAGTYIFRRVMDFNNPEAYYASYYVFGADGQLVGYTGKIAVPVFTTIEEISFATEKADKAVLLDNYRISLSGRAADFELYDAKTGIPVADMTVARDTATAYRLSWLNATATTQTAKVIAAIYEGDTLKEERVIKQVQMAPGCDGVETGIVDVAQGQRVKVSLDVPAWPESDNGGSPSTGTDATTPTQGNPGQTGSNTMIIVLIVVVVVAVAAVVLVLVLTKKPAKKDEK